RDMVRLQQQSGGVLPEASTPGETAHVSAVQQARPGDRPGHGAVSDVMCFPNPFQTSYIQYGSTWLYGNQHNRVYDPSTPHGLHTESQGAVQAPAGAAESGGTPAEDVTGAAGLS
ncbi:hypothetical protein Vafri_9455, partial [Volvox africanus]